jgi:hypothetical protein
MTDSMPAAGGKLISFGVDWPGRPLPMSPGDFSRIVPHGMALDVGPIVRPSDGLAQAMRVPNYYGLEAVNPDPVRGAPTQYPDGGVIYFEVDRTWELIEAALRLIGVRLHEREFGVFQGEAADPFRDHYLDQARIVSKDALIGLFRVGADVRQIERQPVPIEGYVQQFFREQEQKWDNASLRGTAGGDGDWAKERLAFGFMVENQYWGVYRIWSRPWLLTK